MNQSGVIAAEEGWRSCPLTPARTGSERCRIFSSNEFMFMKLMNRSEKPAKRRRSPSDLSSLLASVQSNAVLWRFGGELVASRSLHSQTRDYLGAKTLSAILSFRHVDSDCTIAESKRVIQLFADGGPARWI
jgi:hypothetical protein